MNEPLNERKSIRAERTNDRSRLGLVDLIDFHRTLNLAGTGNDTTRSLRFEDFVR